MKHTNKWINIEGRFNLTGVQYSDYQLVCGKEGLGPETICDIYWERFNRFDPLALAIYYKDIFLGYVPKGSIQQSELHHHHDKKRKCIAIITAFNKRNPTWCMITVQCKYCEDKNVKVPKQMIEL